MAGAKLEAEYVPRLLAARGWAARGLAGGVLPLASPMLRWGEAVAALCWLMAAVMGACCLPGPPPSTPAAALRYEGTALGPARWLPFSCCCETGGAPGGGGGGGPPLL